MAIKSTTKNNHTLLSLISFLLVLLPGLCYCQTDKLQQGQVLKDGEELVSAFGNFRLGFFSPYGTRNRYLAIYYKKPRDRAADVSFDSYSRCRPVCYAIGNRPRKYPYSPAIKKQPVWIANRETPVLRNESASLIIDSTDGNLKILRNGKNPIGISSVRRAGNTTSATLLKNGNLVLYEMNSDGLSIRRGLWQSFDYPTHALLPGMKLGINLQTGHQWFLQSSESAEGSYRLGLGTDPNMTSKLVIWKNDKVVWTSAIWLNNSLPSYTRSSDDEINNSLPSYTRSSDDGINNCLPSYRGSRDDDSNYCCNPAIFDYGFYNFSYTSNEQERYLTYSVNEDVTSFPVLTIDSKWWFWLIIAAAVVLGVCLLLYLGYVIRRKYFDAKEEKRWMSLVIVVGVVSVVPLLSYVSFLLLKKLKAKVEGMVNRQKLLRELGHNVSLPIIFGNRKTQVHNDQTVKRDLKIFDFQTIAAATDNFSPANRLGQGGFGPVYNGKLLDGQEIAIKRLSKSSGQGIVEFKNEAKLIAKLQHTNLVRLIGCSLQGGERLLVYEYLPNKSLDFFIFHSSRKSLLDWKKRFYIIEGIVQGLLYLHKYSRLRAIHRDLKVSNILLDEQMNPKISDFGMARTYAMNELEANTNRIVGTHGYMSPEYVMNGIVSMKSDVYSFGVLVLEIVSSKKNNGSYDTERPLNLVGYAWQLWNEGKALELMDPTLDESCSSDEVMRCIHVGLLCVQDRAADRRTMSDVVSMLTNDTMALPKPKQPAFFINISSDYEEPDVTEIKLEVCSVNDVTISRMEGR
ncbi:G-type lectin S-receptor-like serine/threonine-protein kinase [Citrus sinensis]|nr:G-type lectin S-receptor-like serine/threonine-protein kinase [Citrus sinensis]